MTDYHNRVTRAAISWIWAALSIVLISCSGKADKTENLGTSGETSGVSSADEILQKNLAQGTLSQSINIDENPARWRSLTEDMPIHKMKSGHVFYFGSEDSKFDQVVVTLVDDSTAKVLFKHRWAFNGNRDDIRESVEEGEYVVERKSDRDVVNDNEYWPVFDSLLILRNDKYGFDNGYTSLAKRFCFSKSKRHDSNEKGEARLYPWLDPVNYPSRKGEYAFSSSHELYRIDAAK